MLPELATVTQVAKSVPSPVRIANVPPGSVSSWLTLAVICAGIVMAYFRFVPKNRETISARANALEDERRGDMDAMRGDIRELRKMVNDAIATAQAAESRSAILRAIVSMLTAEVQRMDPGNPVLKQAQAMIRDASSGDLGLGRGMADIAAKVAELP